ncbi:hypothetical protein KI387_039519, partial [Taxus chinensis]
FFSETFEDLVDGFEEDEIDVDGFVIFLMARVEDVHDSIGSSNMETQGVVDDSFVVFVTKSFVDDSDGASVMGALDTE